MAYYNYHAKIKKLIAQGHLTGYEIRDGWNGISPALVLYFDNNRPMPVREYRWDEYFKLLGIQGEAGMRDPQGNTPRQDDRDREEESLAARRAKKMGERRKKSGRE